MSFHQDLRSHLGEREFVDYPVFVEAGVAERGVLLWRALIAAVGVAAVGATLIAVIL